MVPGGALQDRRSEAKESHKSKTRVDSSKTNQYDEEGEQQSPRNEKRMRRKMESAQKLRRSNATREKKNAIVRKNTVVIVEDASDSEMEDDRARSVWRNRR